MFTEDKKLYVAHCNKGPIYMNGNMANRHGLIAGATGTGKTVTLQVLAETFSQAGVPCLMTDIKGDLSGVSQAGGLNGFISKRCEEFGIQNPEFKGSTVRFFDIFGKLGVPMRSTISSMGPQLLARLLELNETQTGILNIVFKIADDQGLLLIDLKDLRMMLDFVAKNSDEFITEYGNISAASVGAIQRSLLVLENQGAEKFFGEPEFNIMDLIQTENGKGVLNIICADELMLNPKLYSTFMLWLLSELYSELPEEGDMLFPKLVFFVDEAHLLFDGTSKALEDKIEQVVRLIRSKGVGVYFITQTPNDIPESILGQLGNRVQHALRAFTPKDLKAVRAAAQTFRANPEFKTEDAITQLGTGEALVSFLDEDGAPQIVEMAKILFPLSQIGAITQEQRDEIQANLPADIKKYYEYFDRESAYEKLSDLYKKAEEAALAEVEEEEIMKAEQEAKKEKKEKKSISRTILGTMIGAAATSFARSLGTNIAKSISGSVTRKTTSKSTSKTNTTKGKVASTISKSAKKGIESATRSAFNTILKEFLK